VEFPAPPDADVIRRNVVEFGAPGDRSSLEVDP